MDAMEMLLNRRSIRKFKSEQIKDEELASSTLPLPLMVCLIPKP